MQPETENLMEFGNYVGSHCPIPTPFTHKWELNELHNDEKKINEQTIKTSLAHVIQHDSYRSCTTLMLNT